jgi:hypothetical protein
LFRTHPIHYVAVLTILAAGCNRVKIGGEIQKVRVYGNDEAGTAVVVDFRLTNRARIPLVVGDVEVEIEDAKGNVTAGGAVADIDAERFLAARPELGPKFNPTLTRRTKLSGGETRDFMIAASFPQSEAEVQARKLIRVRVRDLDGPVFEFTR